MKKQSFFKRFIYDRRDIFLPLALISIGFPMTVFISFPIDIFCRNLDEFKFALSDFLPICILLFAVSAAALFLLLAICPKPVYKLFFPIIVGFAVMFFIQGMFLNGGTLYLSGDNMGSTVQSSKVIVNAVIWIAVIAEMYVIPAIFKSKSGAKVMFIVLGVILLGNQVVNTATALLTSPGVTEPYIERILREPVLPDDMKLTPKDLYRLSTCGLTDVSEDGNVFVFCVDRFDADYADEALEKCPEVFDILDGFTYYNDNISRYGHTYPSITYMLTGRENDMPKDRKQYFVDAYVNAKTLSGLRSAGYSVNIYTDGYYAYDNAAPLLGTADNVVTMTDNSYTVTDKKGLALDLVKISLYRGFPFALKDKVGDGLSTDSCNKYAKSPTDYPEYTVDMKDLYDTVTGTPFETRSGKRFSFIHFSGCHGVDYNEDWEEPQDSEKHDIMISLKNSMKIIGKYISELKARGLYEDATIIITGDHAAAYSDTAPLSGTRVTALFVKPKGSSGSPLTISSAQVSHENLWATVGASEGIGFGFDAGKSVFEIPENEDQVREYVWQTTESGGFHSYYYEINGSARDFSNWTLKDVKESDTTLYH